MALQQAERMDDTEPWPSGAEGSDQCLVGQFRALTFQDGSEQKLLQAGAWKDMAFDASRHQRQAMWTLSALHPEFVIAGVPLPSDCSTWSSRLS